MKKSFPKVLRVKLAKGQELLAQHLTALPKGDSLQTVIVTDKDAVIQTTALSLRAGGIGTGKTCAWCDGVSIGCITCGPGATVEISCIEKTIKCGTKGGFQGFQYIVRH
jgi:hypothetical protein